MTADRGPQQDNSDALERQAIAWLLRVTDDDATEEDREALLRWQAADPAHAQAFTKASTLWHAMPSAIGTAVKSGQVSLAAPGDYGAGPVGRRSVMVGFATAAAAAAAYGIIKPPLGLWPSLSELTADYRTATGQQRRIAISDAISVEMNTRTSIVLHPTTDAFHRFELITGEAVVNAAAAGRRPVQVIAADGLSTGEAADFDVRCDAVGTSVTCLGGVVQVQHHDHSVALREKQQVFYGRGAMGAVATVDPAVVTAWREGYLMFRQEPLAHVIAEVNRYRPGRIVLLDNKLGQGLVTARFRLDRLDDVMAQVREVFGATVRILPGGLVLIG